MNSLLLYSGSCLFISFGTEIVIWYHGCLMWTWKLAEESLSVLWKFYITLITAQLGCTNVLLKSSLKEDLNFWNLILSHSGFLSWYNRTGIKKLLPYLSRRELGKTHTEASSRCIYGASGHMGCLLACPVPYQWGSAGLLNGTGTTRQQSWQSELATLYSAYVSYVCILVHVFVVSFVKK